MSGTCVCEVEETQAHSGEFDCSVAGHAFTAYVNLRPNDSRARSIQFGREIPDWSFAGGLRNSANFGPLTCRHFLPLPSSKRLELRSEIAYGAYENQRIVLNDKTWFLTLTPCWKMVPGRLNKYRLKSVTLYMYLGLHVFLDFELLLLSTELIKNVFSQFTLFVFLKQLHLF